MSSLTVNSFILFLSLLLFYQSIEQSNAEPAPTHLERLLGKLRNKSDESSEEDDHRKYSYSNEDDDDDFRHYKPKQQPPVSIPPPGQYPSFNYYPPPENYLTRPPVYFPPYRFGNQGLPSTSSSQSSNDEIGIDGDHNTVSKLFDVDTNINIPITVVQN